MKIAERCTSKNAINYLKLYEYFIILRLISFIIIILKNSYMADTFTQLYIHIVFAVQNRNTSLNPSWEDELYKYITGIIQNKGNKMLAINGTSNHIHFLIGMKPTCCLSDLVREVKKSSNAFIKEKRFSKYRFQWQEGFGAFSYSHTQLNEVIKYISKQKDHHKKRTFKEEYEDFLRSYEIAFTQDHLFEWFEENNEL
jgi:putative transposase